MAQAVVGEMFPMTGEIVEFLEHGPAPTAPGQFGDGLDDRIDLALEQAALLFAPPGFALFGRPAFARFGDLDQML